MAASFEEGRREGGSMLAYVGPLVPGSFLGVGLGDGDGVEVGPEVVVLALVPVGRVECTTQAQRTQ